MTPARSHQPVLMSHRLPEGRVTAALADPLRARIVGLLADEQLCTCHLVEMTGASQSNVSNHLRVLRDAGIVTMEPAGRYTYYRLDADLLEALSAELDDLARRARVARERRRPCS